MSSSTTEDTAMSYPGKGHDMLCPREPWRYGTPTHTFALDLWEEVLVRGEKRVQLLPEIRAWLQQHVARGAVKTLLYKSRRTSQIYFSRREDIMAFWERWCMERWETYRLKDVERQNKDVERWEAQEARLLAEAEAMILANDENPAVIAHREQVARRADDDARLVELMDEIRRKTVRVRDHLCDQGENGKPVFVPEVLDWIEVNVTGEWSLFWGRVTFRDENEAFSFKMRWV
jgi:hypothetical protein